MNLKKLFRSAIIVLMASGFSSFLVAGISVTKHNLTPSGTGTVKANAGELNEELCAYCHTPHGADTSFSGAPLWNKGAMTTGGFVLYGGGTTIAGTSLDGDTANGVNAASMACLSCHDGVSAINSIVNAPGSGNYVPAGALATFGGSAAATVIPDTVARIGRDLSNDHPVSITYTVGAAGLKATNTVLAGWSGASTIADLLRGASKVECGSCHNPHESTTQTFLRVDNANSALCLGCHDK